jgi:ribosomal protein S19
VKWSELRREKGEKRKRGKEKAMQRKKRSEVIRMEDRNQMVEVHNGKTRVKRQVVNPRSVGLKWGERAKTRKPCRKGANKSVKVKKPRKK